MSSPIGFVGIGIMGKGMLNRLIGHFPDNSFVVWNRGTEVSNGIAVQHPNRVSVGESPAHVVRACHVTFTMLSTPEASQAVYDGESGILSGISDSTVLVDCATLTPERMIELSEAVRSRGGRFLEAPVSGSKAPAELGQLIFLCGGDAAVFEEVSPYLDVMGKAKFLFGPVGQGTRVKIVVNMALGSVMTALGEALALGNACEIPADQLLQVFDLGALSSPLFKGKGAAILKNNFDANFPLKHQHKDMRFALDLAKQKGLQLPTAEGATQSYASAEANSGLGDEDFSAVFKALSK